jgi:hypothetical protein
MKLLSLAQQWLKKSQNNTLLELSYQSLDEKILRISVQLEIEALKNKEFIPNNNQSLDFPSSLTNPNEKRVSGKKSKQLSPYNEKYESLSPQNTPVLGKRLLVLMLCLLSD